MDSQGIIAVYNSSIYFWEFTAVDIGFRLTLLRLMLLFLSLFLHFLIFGYIASLLMPIMPKTMNHVELLLSFCSEMFDFFCSWFFKYADFILELLNDFIDFGGCIWRK